MYTLWEYGHKYNLDGDAFTTELEDDIRVLTGFEKGSLGDWWVHPDNNPEFTWVELIHLAVGILRSKATKLFVHNLHLEHIPSYSPKLDAELKVRSVSGAKRVNADAGEHYDFTGAAGIAGLMNPKRDEIFNNPPKRDTGNKFRLSGKDEGCCVEGTWYD
jgi:hypothetical protein